MKNTIIFTLIITLFLGFTNKKGKETQINDNTKPSISFSFDDGTTKDMPNYKAEEWSNLIIEKLKKNHIQAIMFVQSKWLDNKNGKDFLQKWNDAGNLIANHTCNHLNYNGAGMTFAQYKKEIQQCDSFIKGYSNYQKTFRFPFLKAGNTIDKRDKMRIYLAQIGYKQGWVTIDDSDWYINDRLIQRLKENPKADLKPYRDYYINHIVDRAKYYDNLSKEINHRAIKHTLLLHINLTSALFLGDLIEQFKKEGWQIEGYKTAIQDPIYSKMPLAMPSDQSLIWALAKESGKFEKQLRYPAEDGEYEKDKMDRLGL